MYTIKLKEGRYTKDIKFTSAAAARHEFKRLAVYYADALTTSNYRITVHLNLYYLTVLIKTIKLTAK